MCPKTILVIVPTRGRKEQCERLLESFYETRTLETVDIAFLTDPDDQETYEGFDRRDAFYGILDPRGSLSEKLNQAAVTYAPVYDALFFVGDDHVFRNTGWDAAMLATLEGMGGSGVVYPDDKRRTDVPEIWLATSDVIEALGHFAEPSLKHYYLDNAWGELGKRTGLIRFCPGAVVEHLHYSREFETKHDKTYSETEEKYGARDLAAFRQWQSMEMAYQASRLRRAFSKDIQWLLEKV